MWRKLIILLGLALAIESIAAEEWTGKFGDWLCYGKTGPFEENYQVNENFANNPEVNNQNIYNLLCTFDRRFTVNNDVYSLHIIFPNCKFSNDNNIFTIRLVKYLLHTPLSEQKYKFYRTRAKLIDDGQYQISFPNKFNPDADPLSNDKNAEPSFIATGTQINRDQNVKSLFFINILNNLSFDISIDGADKTNIVLEGLQKGIQNPYCNN